MNPVDSDLEEGEILDDSPSSSPFNKHRELPQRYIIHEKLTLVHKHKKDCKHAIHYHAKKSAKKISKLKNCRKRHRKSCSHEKSRRPSDKISTNVEKKFSKNGHSLPNYTLIGEIKGSLKDHSIKKQSTKYVSKPEENISEVEKLKNNSSKSEVIRENSGTQLENSTSLIDSKHSNQLSDNNTEDLIILSSDSDTNVNTNALSKNTSDNLPKGKDEESEDEEELRRIALATCIKRKAVLESSENLVKNVDCNAVSISDLSTITVKTSNHEISSPSSDNYDVVDMEVDEDIESSIEILNNCGKDKGSEFTENLFVIDTKPSEDLKENVKKNTLPELPPFRNSSDEDFEADILRAELIESLCRKKDLQDKCVEGKKPNAKIHQKQASTLPEKKHVGKYKKLNANFYHKQLRPNKLVRKTVVNKGETLQCNSSKPSSPILVNKPSEKRFVIDLNESSSEDSVDSESENPVASIEALISDCRQKSDSNEKTQETVTNVPKAVACLSKAQQKEYTDLLQIIAKKEKLQGPSNTFQHKNGSVHIELKRLERQLIGFKETLKKKKELMSYLSREIASKKFLYMKSKSTAQQLKQQYLAADKIKKANLGTWSKSCSDFRNVKKTVSDLESKIIHLQNQLQNHCSKVSAPKLGRTYNKSSLLEGNR